MVYLIQTENRGRIWTEIKAVGKNSSKRQILLIAAAALAAVLLLTGRLTPAGLINSLLGTDIPEAQQTYESVQPAETAEDLPPAEKNEPPEDDG